MKVRIDPDLCTACGLCTDGVPQVFKMGKDLAEVINPAVPAKSVKELIAGIELFAAMPAAATASVRSLAVTDLSGRCGLIIGSEARGVGAEWREAAAHVSIPTVGVESLNAAMAASILLYEVRRQRMLRP